MNPILSIIIPCFNHGKYLQETLNSIELAKDKYPIEVIIVNDGSTEAETISILDGLERKGYFVLHQVNGGLGNARNNGIALAKGKYILPLDSDNNVLKPYLNKAIDIFEENELIDIVYGNAVYFGEKQGDWLVGEYNFFKLLEGNYIDACAIYRKTVWESIKGYDENMPVMGVEDWDFWLASSFKGFRFYYLEEACFQYRVLNNSMIHSISSLQRQRVVNFVQQRYYPSLANGKIEDFFVKKFAKDENQIAKQIGAKVLIKALVKKIKDKVKVFIKI